RTPEDWRPEDSYLVVFAQAMVLDFGLPEIGEADDIDRLGKAAFAARQRYEGEWTYVTMPDSGGAAGRGESATRRTRETGLPLASRPDEPRLAVAARATLGEWGAAFHPDERA